MQKYVLGVVGLDRKLAAKPMQSILKHLKDDFIIHEIDSKIQELPIEEWPIVDCLLCLGPKKGVPLQKIQEYCELRKPFVPNKIPPLMRMMDRSYVYKMLEQLGVNIPEYVIVERKDGKEICKFEEHEDYIKVDDKILEKPFVEKPIDGTNHNINIYYHKKSGGGCRKLFRKSKTKSSEFYPEVNRVRRDSTYIYEKFLDVVDKKDVKVYVVDDIVYAEQRKAPTVDGIVVRNKDGFEVREVANLREDEIEMCKKVAKGFNQTYIGMDILRTKEKSYICDVNGFAMVKGNPDFYPICAEKLKKSFILIIQSFSTGKTQKMKLATLDNGTRDGQLIIVNKEGTKYVDASDIAKNLQQALDNWKDVEAKLVERYNQLCSGELDGQAKAVDVTKLRSPLPRAYEWIDGSAYINHIILVRKARGAEPPPTLKTDPLVYQGGSGTFLNPTQDIEHYSEDYGIDFEAEICIITDDVPMGTKKEDAAKYIRLFMLANDVTLRNLIPNELAKGFGFFVSKPSTAFSPFAVTPDELGDAFKDGRIHLDLETYWNGKLFGNPNAGPEMHFSFFDLIEHATKTRALTAGTIIGSGTVSNEDRSRGSSCIAEKRMLEKIDTGKFITPFMKFGDTVEIEMKDKEGRSIFGKISQKVTKKE